MPCRASAAAVAESTPANSISRRISHGREAQLAPIVRLGSSSTISRTAAWSPKERSDRKVDFGGRGRRAVASQRRRGVRRQTPGAARHWRRAMRRGSLRNRRADGEGRRGLTTSPGHYRGAGDVTRAVGRVAGSHTVLSAWRGDSVNCSRPTANAREARRGARSIPATGVRTGRTAGTSHRPGSSRCSRVRSLSTQSSSTYSFHSLGNYETRGLAQSGCQDEIGARWRNCSE